MARTKWTPRGLYVQYRMQKRTWSDCIFTGLLHQHQVRKRGVQLLLWLKWNGFYRISVSSVAVPGVVHHMRMYIVSWEIPRHKQYKQHDWLCQGITVILSANISEEGGLFKMVRMHVFLFHEYRWYIWQWDSTKTRTPVTYSLGWGTAH